MPIVDTPPVLASFTGVEPAPFFWRIVALGLDCLLAGLVASFILTRLVLPHFHPGFEDTLDLQLKTWKAEYNQAEKTGASPTITYDDKTWGIVEDTSTTFFLTMLVYFMASELVTGGSTLGKRVFGMRAARWDTGERPGVMEILSRSLFKAASLLPLGPIPVLFLANAIPVFVRPSRRAGHDYLARTIVTRMAAPPLPEDPFAHDDEA